MHLSKSFKHVTLLYLSILILFFHQKTYLLQFPLITCQGRYVTHVKYHMPKSLYVHFIPKR
jgi:hypothetical protein